MYTCTHCGAEVAALYRRYSPNVLKVLYCNVCGKLADKYIEYDPVIVLLDLVLLQKSAYRHLLYNSSFNSYWKLLIILILGEAFKTWATGRSDSSFGEISFSYGQENDVFQGEWRLYILLIQTALSLSAFILTIIICTEVRWLVFHEKPHAYKTINLAKALIIGKYPKLLVLLGIIWQHHVPPNLHYYLVHGYEALCLLTAYTVVSETEMRGSLIVLILGFLAHGFVSIELSEVL